MTKIDYKTPAYIKRTLEKLSEESEFEYDADGFDVAYENGLLLVYEILEDWDFGLSESYIKGLKRALEIYEEEKANKSNY